MHINSKYEFGCGVPIDLKSFQFLIQIVNWSKSNDFFTSIDNKGYSGGAKDA